MNSTAAQPLPALGVARLDDSHAAIVQAIDVLVRCEDGQLAPALRALGNLLADHFEDEDRDLRSLGGDEHACHLDEHAAVLASVAQVTQVLAAGGFATARRLGEELQRWFPGHVDEMDRRLARALFLRRTGGAPVQLTRRPAARS